MSLAQATATMRIFGKCFDVATSAADVARSKEMQREWNAEKRRRRTKALSVIRAFSDRLDNVTLSVALNAIDQCCSAEGSDNRLSTLLSLIEDAHSKLFWPALIRNWSGCDDTWRTTTRLLGAMQAHERFPRQGFYSEEQRVFYDSLPDSVEVFRGCSLPRLRGISWTTDRAISESFARGHRSIRVPEPVVASAVIPKKEIFFVATDRQESEIVLNPDRLRKIRTLYAQQFSALERRDSPD